MRLPYSGTEIVVTYWRTSGIVTNTEKPVTSEYYGTAVDLALACKPTLIGDGSFKVVTSFVTDESGILLPDAIILLIPILTLTEARYGRIAHLGQGVNSTSEHGGLRVTMEMSLAVFVTANKQFSHYILVSLGQDISIWYITFEFLNSSVIESPLVLLHNFARDTERRRGHPWPSYRDQNDEGALIAAT